MAKKAWMERLKKGRKFSSRHNNRCVLCGRSRSYMRKFNICRICFRKLAHQGRLPGVTKSSW